MKPSERQLWRVVNASADTYLNLTLLTATTAAVGTITSITITANYGGSAGASLTVKPPVISSVSLSPTSVAGGSTSTGTVRLNGPAPSSGSAVTLATSNTTAATVPASVTIAPGSASATFTITTSAVSTTTTVTITATYPTGSAQTATLTVTAGTGSSILTRDAVAFKDNSSSANSITSATFSTTSSNELLLAFIATDGPSSGTNTTVTGVTGAGLTWILVKRTNVQRGTAEVWRAFASALLTNVSVQATLSSGQRASLSVVTFAGVDTSGTNGSGAIGATGTANAATGAPTASLLTTRNNSWVIGVGNDWDRAVARTPGANQSLVHQFLSSVGDTYWVQMQNSPTPLSGTTVSINDTAPTTDRFNLSLVELLPHP